MSRPPVRCSRLHPNFKRTGDGTQGKETPLVRGVKEPTGSFPYILVSPFLYVYTIKRKGLQNDETGRVTSAELVEVGLP